MKGIMQQIEEIHELATTLGIQMKDSADTRIQMVDKIFQVERDLIDLQKAEKRDGNFKD